MGLRVKSLGFGVWGLESWLKGLRSLPVSFGLKTCSVGFRAP